MIDDIDDELVFPDWMQDLDGAQVKVGERVIIICPANKKFYNKTGTAIIVDRRHFRVLVQMDETQGGIWWRPLFLRADLGRWGNFKRTLRYIRDVLFHR